MTDCHPDENDIFGYLSFPQQKLINTSEGKLAQKDSFNIRRYAIVSAIPYCTTISGAIAAESAIKSMTNGELDVKPIQEYYMEGCSAVES